MFNLFLEENWPVLIGLGVGGGIALLSLLMSSFLRSAGTGHGASARTVLSLAIRSASERAGSLILLWIGVSAGYTVVSLLYSLIGRSTSVFDAMMTAVLIFLGHRALLESPARAVGIEMPEAGYWRILLRSIVFGLLGLATAGMVFLVAALLVALASYAGITGEAPLHVVGALAGVTAIRLSVLFARLSFLYPASVLGQRDWFGGALQRSVGMGPGLAASLWIFALAATALVIPVMLWSSALVDLIAANLPASPGELPGDFGTARYWATLVFEELPLNLLIVAYCLGSIACVSAAYRLAVLDRDSDKPGIKPS
ncbi:hypothetical protein [uncultured Maricaulis sp.]|uniref:hypothetical protein n=1 Tax=uncultured Maricaulis sp. TaxID=174710 RepID=UPI00260A1C4B|nr:hypothetical protein [uncultured Maricaulis sp.]